MIQTLLRPTNDGMKNKKIKNHLPELAGIVNYKKLIGIVSHRKFYKVFKNYHLGGNINKHISKNHEKEYFY